MWWDKDTNGGIEEIFKVFTPIGDASRQVITNHKLSLTPWFVVKVAVEHGFKASCGNTRTEVFYKWPIVVQWMNRPSSPKPFWNSFTHPRPAKRNDGKRDWTPLADFTVCTFQVLG
jgi:hypothetical protein